MKKLFVLAVLILSTYSSNSFANYCWVTSGSNGGPNSLRHYVENMTSSSCTAPSGDPSDADYFDQVILFATTESGTCNDGNYDGDCNDGSDTFVNNIRITSSVEIPESAGSIVIGNWTDTIADTTDIDYDDDYLDVLSGAGDFGRVVIRASFLAEGELPFVCSETSDDVYFRNVTIITNGVTRAEFFDDTNPETACLKNAGSVRIISHL